MLNKEICVTHSKMNIAFIILFITVGFSSITWCQNRNTLEGDDHGCNGPPNLAPTQCDDASLFGYKVAENTDLASEISFFGALAGQNSYQNYNTGFGYRAGEGASLVSLYRHVSVFGRNTGANLENGHWNSFMGSGSGVYTSTGGHNSFFGNDSGRNNKSGSRNSFFGEVSGYQNGNSTRGDLPSNDNSFMGWASGYNNTSGERNSFFGQKAGFANTLGKRNAILGSEAGMSNISGSYNTLLGASSGLENTSASYNTFIGFVAGRDNTTGDYNTMIGQSVALHNISGTYNVYLGADAAKGNEIGSGNTFVGNNNGYNMDGDNNVLIGNNAGPFQKNVLIQTPIPPTSKQLYIDIKAGKNPLIYGDFNEDVIKINGELEVMGGISHSSNRDSKTNINPINHDWVFDQLKNLNIFSWEYIDHAQVVHIGPMAQDFNEAFAIGNIENSIASVDSDGVALSILQSLSVKNQMIKNQYEELRAAHAQALNTLNELEDELIKIENRKSE